MIQIFAGRRMTQSDKDYAINTDAAELDVPGTAEPDGGAEAGAGDGRLAELQAENAMLKDRLMRALADTENLRRRTEREREDTAKYAVSKFAGDLLSVADNLRRAIDAVPAEARETDEFVKNLLAGVEATERELLQSFERAGIKKNDPSGQPFDPNFHEVLFEVPSSGQPSGTVVQLVQPGYTIHGRLLRPARVGVAKADAQDQRLNTMA
jgi:molecular chaperone GrpE